MPRQAGLSIGPAPLPVVAGILMKRDDSVLITDRAGSRSMRDHWEFPGGKIDDGECNETALHRELAEELGIQVTTSRHFHYLQHDYPDFRVAIDFYIVSAWEGEPAGLEGQQLRWVPRQTLPDQRLLPADAPVIDLLTRFGS